MDRESLIEQLVAENEEFRQLRTDHQGYDREIAQLQAIASLSAEQHWRIAELKKLKLMAKDRMEAMIRNARARATA